MQVFFCIFLQFRRLILKDSVNNLFEDQFHTVCLQEIFDTKSNCILVHNVYFKANHKRKHKNVPLLIYT